MRFDKALIRLQPTRVVRDGAFRRTKSGFYDQRLSSIKLPSAPEFQTS